MNSHDRSVLLAGIRAEVVSKTWAIREEYEPLLRALAAGDGQISLDLAANLEARSKSSGGEDYDTGGGVATIGVHGPITSAPSLLSLLFGLDSEPLTSRVGRQIKSAAANPDVKAIVMDFDSPGGTVDYVPELAADIRSARKTKPVTAVANTMAGSAAYWLASQASDISVAKSGDVGSIGVYQLHDDISEADKQAGIKTTLIKAGPHKAEGLPYFPLSDEAKAHRQMQVDHFYDMFTGDVAKGRRVTPSKVKSDFGGGRMLLAKHAVKAGLADRVESLDAARSRLQSMSASQLSEQAAMAAEEDARWMLENKDLLEESEEKGPVSKLPTLVALTEEDRMALLELHLAS